MTFRPNTAIKALFHFQTIVCTDPPEKSRRVFAFSRFDTHTRPPANRSAGFPLEMSMNLDSQAAIIINDLDSLRHRIEGLQAHPSYTDALNLVTQARDAVTAGRSAVHQREMKERFSKLDAA